MKETPVNKGAFQERAVAMRVSPAYAQAMCLELNDCAAWSPFTTLEQWWNNLSNDDLASENLPVNKPSTKVSNMRLNETAKEFQADIGRIAAAAGRQPEDVYALWQQYETQCTDQSAVLAEFIQWYEADLGGDHAALVDAIDARHRETTVADAVAESNARNGIPEDAGEVAPPASQEAATPEPAALEQPQKWQASTTDTPGPRQVKQFNDAWNKFRTEHNTTRELWGTIGGEEHESCMCSLFGVTVRADVRAVELEIGKRYNWTISRKNAAAVVADILASFPTLAKNRPVIDKRETQAQKDEWNAKMRAAEAERKAQEQAKQRAADAIAGDLRAKYPWAKPAGGLSNHARAAANCREDLARAFPGTSFSVRSDYNSLRIEWELGPSEKTVEAVADKYKNGHFDGMTDSHEYDRSAYGKAVEQVLGRVTYVSYNRRFDTVEQSSLLCPILAKLMGLEYDTTKEPWNNRLPSGEYYGTAVRVILANTDFPSGAVITGLEAIGDDERETGIAGNEYHKLYRATFTVPHQDATATNGGRTTGALGTVAYNKEHNGVEIAFTDKPDDNLRWQLKRAGFRITRRPPWKWYQKFTASAWKRACELAGVTMDAPKASEESGPDRFDMQVEDNMAAACGL